MISPKVDEVSLNRESFLHIYKNEDFELYNTLSQKEVIRNQVIYHPITYKSTFKHTFFTSSDFQGMEIIDRILGNCDFSDYILTKSISHHVEFVSCKLTGTKLIESYIGNTLFENCKIDYVDLSGSNIKESIFEHSVLSSADFVDCFLTKIVLSANDPENVSFFNTDLKNIDLSDNSFEMIEVRSEHLKSCTLNQLQALNFAGKFLRIKVVRSR